VYTLLQYDWCEGAQFGLLGQTDKPRGNYISENGNTNKKINRSLIKHVSCEKNVQQDMGGKTNVE
jgi:hypothetical protein